MIFNYMRLLVVALLGIYIADAQQPYQQPSYVMSSSWSMWSPWSFCSHGVMIRVRACSTVRGFKCVGHNKEFQTCDSRASKPKDIDYSSEEDDSELARQQLYDDYDSHVSPHPKDVSRKQPMKTRKPTILTTPSASTTTPITTTPITTTTTTTTPAPAPTTTTAELLILDESAFASKPQEKEESDSEPEEIFLPTETTVSSTSQSKHFYKASYVTKTPLPPQLPTRIVSQKKEAVNKMPTTGFVSSSFATATTPRLGSKRKNSEFSYNSREFELGAPARKSYPIVTDEDVFESEHERNKARLEEQLRLSQGLVRKNTVPGQMEGTSSLNSWDVNEVEANRDGEVETVEIVMPTTKSTASSESVATSSMSSTTTTTADPTTETSLQTSSSSGVVTVGINPQVVMPVLPSQPKIRKLKTKGKKTRLDRLKKLNERARTRTLSVIATHKNPKTFNSGEVKRAENTKTEGQTEEELVDDGLSDDTAKALSWLLANMTASVDDFTESLIEEKPLLDASPSPSTFIITKAVKNGQSSFRGQFTDAVSEEEEEKWSDWSHWSECNCGFTYRKRICIAKSETDKCKPAQYEKKSCLSIDDHCQQRS